MKENTETIIAMLDELLTISKNHRTSQSGNTNRDITPIKILIEDGNRQNDQHTEAKLTKFARAILNNLNAINNRIGGTTQKEQPNFEDFKKLLVHTAQKVDAANLRHNINKIRHLSFIKTKWNWASVIGIVLFASPLISAFCFVSRPKYERMDNDLRYCYIKMKGEASPEQIAKLENLFVLNRHSEKIDQMHKGGRKLTRKQCGSKPLSLPSKRDSKRKQQRNRGTKLTSSRISRNRQK